MDDTNQIEDWIAKELNRGTSPELLKSKLTEYGYDAKLVDIFLLKNAVSNNPPAQVQNTNQAQQSTPLQSTQQPNAAPAAEFDGLGFFGKVKMILLDPKKFFDIMPRSGGYGEPYRFFLVAYISSTILTYGVNFSSLLKLQPMFQYYIYFLAASFIISLLSPFISAFFLNLLFKLFGGKGNYESTFRVICYVVAVSLVSWIPYVGGLVGLYGLYIAIVGYSKVHQISGWRILAAFVVIAIILAIASFAIFYTIYTSMQSAFRLSAPAIAGSFSSGTTPLSPGITANLLRMALS